MTTTRARGETAEIQRLDQIPHGMTEDEADQFWETHSLGDALLNEMEPFPEDFPLPPRRESANPVATESSQTLKASRVILGSVVAVGVLLIGWYVISRLVKAGVDLPEFLPTPYPNLRVLQGAGKALSVTEPLFHKALS